MTHELSVISLCPAPPPWYTLITQNHCQKSETNFYSFFKSQLSEFCQVNETADPDLAPQGLTSLRKGLMEQFILSVKHGTGSVMGAETALVLHNLSDLPKMVKRRILLSTLKSWEKVSLLVHALKLMHASVMQRTMIWNTGLPLNDLKIN